MAKRKRSSQDNSQRQVASTLILSMPMELEFVIPPASRMELLGALADLESRPLELQWLNHLVKVTLKK